MGMIMGAFFIVTPTYAVSLKLAPLEYRTTLRSGEKQKGYVDVSNPTTETLRVKTSAQAFRQVDDNGTLQFYEDEKFSSGVLLDLDEFDLGPHEAVRMYFILDGSKLPMGDVYGAIFFTTTPTKHTDGVGQAVRLGTLLSVVNGTPGQREAKVVSLNTSFIQIGDTVKGSYAIKNTGDPAKATGFYPVVRTSIWPFGEAKTSKGKLIFAGRTRENDFELKTPLVGFYKVSAAFGSSVQSKWIFVIKPVVVITLFVIVLAAWFVLSVRRKWHSHARSSFRIK